MTETTQQMLCDMLEAFQTENCLPLQCAQEQLETHELTSGQRDWLESYVKYWEMCEEGKA